MALFGRKNEQDATLGKPPMGWGVPGVQKDESVDPEMEAMLLTAPAGQRRIGRAEIAEAISILTRYKQGKASLEERVVQDELWWELRHWEAIRKGKQRTDNPEYRGPEPSSAWLFNAILNKHADAMDNYPEPVVLPRERSDEESAKVLSSVLPVILEYNDYEQTYSDNWWEKLKHGTAAYGVFWNSAKENGLGDVDIREIDLLSLIGSLVGLVVGIPLHQFIIRTVEMDQMMFIRSIAPRSFVFSVALTMLFNFVVCLLMRRHVKKISMVESMKAPE